MIFTYPFLKMGLVPALSEQGKAARGWGRGGDDWAVGAAWALHTGTKGEALGLTWEWGHGNG